MATSWPAPADPPTVSDRSVAGIDTEAVVDRPPRVGSLRDSPRSCDQNGRQVPVACGLRPSATTRLVTGCGYPPLTGARSNTCMPKDSR